MVELVYHQNDGAAFSIFAGKRAFLIIITLVILVLIYSLSFTYKSNKLSNYGFGLLIGGVFSNLIDRCIFGFVRDYISLSFFNPIFNIADISIICGILIIIYITIKESRFENENRG